MKLQETTNKSYAAKGSCLQERGTDQINVCVGDQSFEPQFYIIRNNIKYIILGRTGLNLI